MAIPRPSPLSRYDSVYGRLDGLNRWYSRIPGSNVLAVPAQQPKLTANLAIMATNTASDQHMIVDKLYLLCEQGIGTGGFQRNTVQMRVTNGVTNYDYYFVHSDYVGAGGESAGVKRVLWDTGGTFVLPPGYSILMAVNDTALECIPLITGYKVTAADAQMYGLTNYITRGVRPNSTTPALLIPGKAGCHARVRNIYICNCAGDGSTAYNARFLFGDGVNSYEFLRSYNLQSLPQFAPDANLKDMSIYGPEGYGVYVSLQPNATIQPISVIVTVEYVRAGTVGIMNVPGSGTISSSAVSVTASSKTYTLNTGTWTQAPPVGTRITISGFTDPLNNGVKTVVSRTTTTIVVAETVADEAQGDAVTIVGVDIPNGQFTGTYASGPTSFGANFWVTLAGEGKRFLTRSGHKTEVENVFLIDGAYMDVCPDGSAPLGSYMGLHAGDFTFPVEPTANILPGLELLNASAAYQHRVYYTDLGGLPCVGPALISAELGAESVMTVWGRVKSKADVLPTGFGNVLQGNNPTS